jgi:hypothetical protein
MTGAPALLCALLLLSFLCWDAVRGQRTEVRRAQKSDLK